VLEMAQRYVAIGQEYPKIGATIHIYHPDLQGPMDICEIIWGSSMFYSLYDQPDLVKALLEIVTETYIRFLRAWTEIVPFREGGNVHWGLFHGGNIMLRDDSAMNLSAAMFNEFIRPYDQRLLAEFGGGAIHFCGRGDHYIADMSEMDGLYTINMSQPDYNDMETIYANTVDKGINIVGLDRAVAEDAVARGRDFHGRVHASTAMQNLRGDAHAGEGRAAA
jgi:uroporphyrinogen-III decarboxylase